MKILATVKLSNHRYKTPEGYLVCKDAILARTGEQQYMKNEVFPGEESDEIINVDRPADEVFSESTLASFEQKPVCCEHPAEDVGPENYNQLAVGHVFNVRKGKFEGKDVMLADLIVNDAAIIEDIENGIRTDLSCGYDCDIRDDGNGKYSQTNIRGNHVALCEQGRAGIARIQDSWGAKPIKDADTMTFLEDELTEEQVEELVDIDNYVIGKDGIWFARPKGQKELFEKAYASPDEGVKWYPCVKEEKREAPSGATQIGKVIFRTNRSFPKGRVSIGRNMLTWYAENAPTQPIDYSLEIDHIDNDYKNDKLDNLQRISHAENIKKRNKVSDSIGKGSLIQEFGKQGKQYRITKIVENVIYAENLETGKIILFKKDEENKEWATISKSEVKDNALMYGSNLSKQFEEEIRNFVQKLGDKLGDVRFDYSTGYIPREHKSWCIIIPYNSKYDEIEEGAYDFASEDKALDKLKEEFTKAGYKSFIQNDHGHIKVYEKSKVKNNYITNETQETITKSEVKDTIKDNEDIITLEECSDCYGMTQEELNEAWKKINEDKKTDIIGNTKNRKLKRFVNKEKRDKFVKSLPEEAEVRMDEFDYGPSADKWLNYWEVYYWDKSIKDSDTWTGYDFKRGPAAEEFKRYLRDRGLYFEPSENGEMIHFEVKNADKWVHERAEDIVAHYAKMKDAMTYVINIDKHYKYVSGNKLKDACKSITDKYLKTNVFKSYKDAIETKEKLYNRLCKKNLENKYYTIEVVSNGKKVCDSMSTFELKNMSKDIIKTCFRDFFSNGSLEDLDFEELVLRMKKREEAINTVRLAPNGKILFIVLSAHGYVNNPDIVWIDIIEEDKDGSNQERIYMEDFKTYDEAIAAFEKWRKEYLENTVNNEFKDAANLDPKIIETIHNILGEEVKIDFGARGQNIVIRYKDKVTPYMAQSNLNRIMRALEKLGIKVDRNMTQNNSNTNYIEIWHDSNLSWGDIRQWKDSDEVENQKFYQKAIKHLKNSLKRLNNRKDEVDENDENVDKIKKSQKELENKVNENIDKLETHLEGDNEDDK